MQQSVFVIRMAMRFGDYALRPTFADENGGQLRRGEGRNNDKTGTVSRKILINLNNRKLCHLMTLFSINFWLPKEKQLPL